MSELPAEVALMWRMRERRRRGPKPSLTVDDITRAAIEIADAEGLAAVSMARVAERLGNSTMALYRHVKSKDELLVLMSDAALERPEPLPEGVDWRTGLTFWAEGVLVAVRKHPGTRKLPISGPPAGPNNLAWFDSALEALKDTGLPEGAKVGVVMGLMTYVQGEIRLSPRPGRRLRRQPGRLQPVRRHAGPRGRPAPVPRAGPDLWTPASSTTVESFEDDSDEDFDFGLQLYLDGVAGFIDRVCRTADFARPQPGPPL